MQSLPPQSITLVSACIFIFFLLIVRYCFNVWFLRQVYFVVLLLLLNMFLFLDVYTIFEVAGHGLSRLMWHTISATSLPPNGWSFQSFEDKQPTKHAHLNPTSLMNSILKGACKFYFYSKCLATRHVLSPRFTNPQQCVNIMQYQWTSVPMVSCLPTQFVQTTQISAS